MATPFDDWLKALASAGKGPGTLFCDRGVPYGGAISIEADLTGATFRGEVRASPDATGSAAATFDIDVSIADGVTALALGLTESEVNALPADSAGDGFVDLVFDLLWTPSGSIEQRLFGGIFKVIGQVTV